eukprot:CAMPEP_0197388628 /NCGR_PEP_ID=MMETSP1165-20131217/1178_1 /TAXON_ID=284809 /ORGANISM="Chrysocystis fragilis, Strain CCMP3189" /LENGTH=217 /DNA_ID=CAMNT_0042913975 /DNA_START=11 /DNA_END=664 /DNA_ORIENTATION=+
MSERRTWLSLLVVIGFLDATHGFTPVPRSPLVAPPRFRALVSRRAGAALPADAFANAINGAFGVMANVATVVGSKYADSAITVGVVVAAAIYFDKRLGGVVDEVDSRLGKKIDEVEDRLGEKIDEVDSRLGKKIDEVDSRLGKDIAGVEGRLGKKIDEVDSRLSGVDSRLSGVENRLSRVENRLSRVEVRLDTVVDVLTEGFTQLNVTLPVTVALRK